MKTITAAFVMALALTFPAMATPVSGATTSYIFVPTSCGGCIPVNSPGPATLTYTYTNPNNNTLATVTGYSAGPITGPSTLGSLAGIDLTNAAPGQYQVVARSGVSDTITLTGVPNGVYNILFSYNVDGSLFVGGAFPSGYAAVQIDGGLKSGPSSPFFAGLQSAQLSGPGDDTFIIGGSGPANPLAGIVFEDVGVAVTGAPLYFGTLMTTVADASFATTPSVSCSGCAAANFAFTAQLINIQVIDGSGHTVTGAQFFDSTGQPLLSGVPEAGGVVPVLGGLLLVALGSLRRRRC